MREYKSPTLGAVRFTEEQHHKLLRRFNPDKRICKDYQHPCICPKPIGDEGSFTCARCKPFGGQDRTCVAYIRELTGAPPGPFAGVSLRTDSLTVYGTKGLEILRKVHSALLGMERVK